MSFYIETIINLLLFYCLSPNSICDAFLVNIGASGSGNLDLNDPVLYGSNNLLVDPTCKLGLTL